MNIQEIYKQIMHNDITNNYINKIKINKKSLSNGEKKYLAKIIGHFKTNNIDDTLKAIKLYAIWEADSCIELSRKKGVFRYKAYKLENNNALYLLNELIKCKDIFNFSDSTLNYLKSKKKLSWIFDFYKKSENTLIKYIKNHHKKRWVIRRENILVESSLFKELLAYIDLTFYCNREVNNEDYLNKDHLKGYSQEEICNGVSYLIFLYDKIIGIKQNQAYFVDTKYIMSPQIEYIILLACKVIELEEWELSIDYFNYKINISKNVLTIFDESELMEKSIRMGFARTEIQEQVFYMKISSILNNALSFNEICDEIVKRLGKKMTTEINDGLLSRYVFSFPEELFDLFAHKGLFRKKLFKEEILRLEYCAKELIMNIDEACKKQITEHCTLLDVLLFQRFFVFIDIFLEKTLFRMGDESKIIQSLIPAFNKDILKSILIKFIGDDIKVEELFELFTYKNKFKLDLQYTPLLWASDNIVYPNTVISKSNMLRNCIGYSYQIKNQLVNDDHGLETLVKVCSEAFQNCKENYMVLTNKKYKYQKQHGEVDVIVVSNDDIILIECKCPLIPVNNFEMRSSLAHIEKANKQLNLSKKAFSDKEFRKSYFKLWDIEDKNQKIKTCIIFGNRLFCGYNKFQHPIRYIYELQTLLGEGIIDSELGKWSMWQGKEYSHHDLINYLIEDNSLSQLNFRAMDNINKEMSINGKNIVFKTYAYNLIKGFQVYDNKLKVISSNNKLKKQIIDKYMNN